MGQFAHACAHAPAQRLTLTVTIIAMTTTTAELIVYACPTGPLAEQLAAYFERSLREVGPNAAHGYMPHVTLTGFFHDDVDSVSTYRAALTTALTEMPAQTPDVLHSVGMQLMADFLYLKFESPWLIALAARFAQHARSSTRRDALRLKDWLHLSLAYDFRPEQRERLAALARESVDPLTPAGWDILLYERDGARWITHGRWPIAGQR